MIDVIGCGVARSCICSLTQQRLVRLEAQPDAPTTRPTLTPIASFYCICYLVPPYHQKTNVTKICFQQMAAPRIPAVYLYPKDGDGVRNSKTARTIRPVTTRGVCIPEEFAPRRSYTVKSLGGDRVEDDNSGYNDNFAEGRVQRCSHKSLSEDGVFKDSSNGTSVAGEKLLSLVQKKRRYGSWA